MRQRVPDRRRVVGKAGEDLAADHLSRNGYRLLKRNYRCRAGEIDIIAMQGSTLVFVEVKTRKSVAFGSPAAAVTPRKQRQISRVAEDYLARENRFEMPARFDVVAIVAPPGQPVTIEIITNAFELHHL
ncbi:MAG: YraN family protein [Desulfopila sp.]